MYPRIVRLTYKICEIERDAEGFLARCEGLARSISVSENLKSLKFSENFGNAATFHENPRFLRGRDVHPNLSLDF